MGKTCFRFLAASSLVVAAVGCSSGEPSASSRTARTTSQSAALQPEHGGRGPSRDGERVEPLRHGRRDDVRLQRRRVHRVRRRGVRRHRRRLARAPGPGRPARRLHPLADAGDWARGSATPARPRAARARRAPSTRPRRSSCNDVDAWLASHGLTATLDCSQVGATSFPTSRSTLPNGPAPFDCGDATQAAFATAQQTLASCNPCDYVAWDTSAQLQLFENGVCDP